MKHRELGKSGISVALIALGGNVFEWTIYRMDCERNHRAQPPSATTEQQLEKIFKGADILQSSNRLRRSTPVSRYRANQSECFRGVNV